MCPSIFITSYIKIFYFLTATFYLYADDTIILRCGESKTTKLHAEIAIFHLDCVDVDA